MKLGCVPAVLLLAACEVSGPLLEVPGTSIQTNVEFVKKRGPYIDAVLDLDRGRIRYFFPDEPPCSDMLADGARVEYVRAGAWGMIRSGEQSCTPLGIGTLERWRAEAPRTSRRPSVRAQANYEILFRDEELAFALGRFPLASYIGWRGGEHTIAVFYAGGECEELLDRNLASMEFRSFGRDAFVLITTARGCPIEGFIYPTR
jgi:hypothetical protein